MRRREFITLLSGAAATWPLVVRAQKSVPVVGLIMGRSQEMSVHLAAAFSKGLRETGFIEGQNVLIEYRHANGQFDRLPALAADLVQHKVAVIAAGWPSGKAAKAATTSIPIVFIGGGDPIRDGLVTSLNRPGGNLTGVIMLASDLEEKRIGLLHDLVPNASVIGVLIDSNLGDAEFQLKQFQSAAKSWNLTINALSVGNERDFDAIFSTLAQNQAGALIVAASTFFNTHRKRLVELANRYRIPAIYELREFVEGGGLMSYSPSLTDVFRQAGIYVGRILKGEKPSELPVLLPTKFELVINLKNAKALGLTIPSGVLSIVDEVIE